MPYIKQQDRFEMDSFLDKFYFPENATEGDMNYLITQAILIWLGDKPNYAKFNSAVGILECAKLELYRRAVAPYEDTKIIENGDVYDT